MGDCQQRENYKQQICVTGKSESESLDRTRPIISADELWLTQMITLRNGDVASELVRTVEDVTIYPFLPREAQLRLGYLVKW
jgi:hypothetical protein